GGGDGSMTLAALSTRSYMAVSPRNLRALTAGRDRAVTLLGNRLARADLNLAALETRTMAVLVHRVVLRRRGTRKERPEPSAASWRFPPHPAGMYCRPERDSRPPRRPVQRVPAGPVAH